MGDKGEALFSSLAPVVDGDSGGKVKENQKPGNRAELVFEECVALGHCARAVPPKVRMFLGRSLLGFWRCRPFDRK